MTELQLLRKLLNERLTAAAIEIFGAIEKTVFEYQEENERLRRMLRISPEKQLYKTEYCDQDRNPGHRDVVVLRGSDLDHSAMRRPDSLQFSVSEEEYSSSDSTIRSLVSHYGHVKALSES
ncbi:hypothetical protein UPYG_G00246240 [Umbra pygmaea]|uniref:Uncharacterized protein n=1 Tax=Umbra pygmaea TaxID=75934 RepID=A0ABD0WGC8_UMBPY